MRRAIVEWRTLGTRLIYTYISNTELSAGDDNLYATLRLQCLGTLLPAAVYRKTQWDLVEPALPYVIILMPSDACYMILNIHARDELLHDVVRFVFAIRKTMRNIEDTTVLENMGFQSALPIQRFLLVIMLLHKTRGEGRYFSVAAITGLSYGEILDQCLIPLPDSPRKVENQMLQMELVSSILAVDRCKDLLDSYLAHGITPYVATIMRRTWDTYRETLVNRHHAADGLIWHDHMVVMWSVILDMDSGARVAIEIVEAKCLFILERWSISASDQWLSNFCTLLLRS